VDGRFNQAAKLFMDDDLDTRPLQDYPRQTLILGWCLILDYEGVAGCMCDDCTRANELAPN
jgi:hypothetical protein